MNDFVALVISAAERGGTPAVLAMLAGSLVLPVALAACGIAVARRCTTRSRRVGSR